MMAQPSTVLAARKSHDCDALDQLHERGYISDPKSNAKSVLLIEEAERLARELFARHFGVDAKQRHRTQSDGLAQPQEGENEFAQKPDFVSR